MADAAFLLVEVLRQLRTSIDAMAEDQAAVRVTGLREEVVQALVDGLADVRRSIDKLANQQAGFQRDMMSVLSDIARDIGRVPEHAEALSGIERDVSLIADRYRPMEPYEPFMPD